LEAISVGASDMLDIFDIFDIFSTFEAVSSKEGVGNPSVSISIAFDCKSSAIFSFFSLIADVDAEDKLKESK
jgi:hypothetical protein